MTPDMHNPLPDAFSEITNFNQDSLIQSCFMLVVNNNSGVAGIASRLHERWSLDAQSIREEERTRIAREIHDELGQWLTALKIEAFLISKTIEDTATQGQLSTMVSLINKTAKAVERIATELRP